MKRKLFGTDGIRGRVNSEPMSAPTAMAVAMAVGGQIAQQPREHRPTAVIGKDTRLSGYMLESALSAGLTATGVDVVLLGPLPTPAIAVLTRSLRADIGIMISASHNAHIDNGIKLFGPDGYKLSDAVEQEIEAMVHNATPPRLASPEQIGKMRRLDDAKGRYIEFVKSSFPRGLRLDGMRVVIDCANGAAHRVAPQILWELGAEIFPIGIEPNGININLDCGSTSIAAMARAVVANNAHIGIALDGDADRVILVDQFGTVIDGDQVMALIAWSWQNQGRLVGDTVVATVMSNLGLERYLASLGIGLLRTGVGDRLVVEAMRRGGYNLGGEQSGHIVLADYATTGDGMVAALQFLASMVETGKDAKTLGQVFAKIPQLLHNVKLPSGSLSAREILGKSQITEAIAQAEHELHGQGRILIRPSGTEPLIRVMAEGEDSDQVLRLVTSLAATITAAAKVG
ncbi:MAG: phosphoglucosamine mutase [Candidatus Pacebacteria bacterium]|nr:phosphoglucosamine mutase [Candidatus Paceibacterota bacterium]